MVGRQCGAGYRARLGDGGREVEKTTRVAREIILGGEDLWRREPPVAESARLEGVPRGAVDEAPPPGIHPDHQADVPPPGRGDDQVRVAIPIEVHDRDREDGAGGFEVLGRLARGQLDDQLRRRRTGFDAIPQAVAVDVGGQDLRRGSRGRRRQRLPDGQRKDQDPDRSTQVAHLQTSTIPQSRPGAASASHSHDVLAWHRDVRSAPDVAAAFQAPDLGPQRKFARLRCRVDTQDKDLVLGDLVAFVRKAAQDGRAARIPAGTNRWPSGRGLGPCSDGGAWRPDRAILEHAFCRLRRAHAADGARSHEARQILRCCETRGMAAAVTCSCVSAAMSSRADRRSRDADRHRPSPRRQPGISGALIGAPRLELVTLDSLPRRSRMIAGDRAGALRLSPTDTQSVTRKLNVLDYGDQLRCSLIMNHTQGRALPRVRVDGRGHGGCRRLVLGVNLDYPTGSPDTMEVARGRTRAAPCGSGSPRRSKGRVEPGASSPARYAPGQPVGTPSRRWRWSRPATSRAIGRDTDLAKA